MKEDNVAIVAMFGFVVALGIFGILAYLFKKEPIPTTTAQTTPAQIASAQTNYVPKEKTGKVSLREAKIGEADKPSEYTKTE